MFKRLLVIFAALLFIQLPSSAVPPNTLVWTYESYQGAPPVHFEIWESTDLEHWTLLGQTRHTYFIFQWPNRETFYRARTVEDASGVYSDWSNVTATGLDEAQTDALNTLINQVPQ